jgi:HSP20 family protein
MAKTAVEVRKEQKAAPPAPLWPPGLDMWQSFRQEMARALEDFWRGRPSFPSLARAFEAEPFWARPLIPTALTPAVDFAEDDKAFRITAELPGMTDKDIDISLSGDMLTIKGEKREEKEEKAENYYVSERRFGSFQRSFTLPDGVDRDKVEAVCDKGVLTLTLPKTAEAVKQQKKIEVKAA